MGGGLEGTPGLIHRGRVLERKSHMKILPGTAQRSKGKKDFEPDKAHRSEQTKQENSRGRNEKDGTPLWKRRKSSIREDFMLKGRRERSKVPSRSVVERPFKKKRERERAPPQKKKGREVTEDRSLTEDA